MFRNSKIKQRRFKQMPVKKEIKSKRNKIKDLKTTRVGLVLLGHGQCSWCITSDDEVKNVVLAFRTARYMRRSWKGIYSFKKEAIINVHIYDITNCETWNHNGFGHVTDENGKALPFIETIDTVL
tara:strand:+ start:185 stop:559 length:375 start_codon:yes stop_codon:yes gene_type:complete